MFVDCELHHLSRYNSDTPACPFTLPIFNPDIVFLPGKGVANILIVGAIPPLFQHSNGVARHFLPSQSFSCLSRYLSKPKYLTPFQILTFNFQVFYYNLPNSDTVLLDIHQINQALFCPVKTRLTIPVTLMHLQALVVHFETLLLPY